MSDHAEMSRERPYGAAQVKELLHNLEDAQNAIHAGLDLHEPDRVLRGLRKALACGLRAKKLADDLERELYVRSGD